MSHLRGKFQVGYANTSLRSVFPSHKILGFEFRVKYEPLSIVCRITQKKKKKKPRIIQSGLECLNVRQTSSSDYRHGLKNTQTTCQCVKNRWKERKESGSASESRFRAVACSRLKNARGEGKGRESTVTAINITTLLRIPRRDAGLVSGIPSSVRAGL